ncbi:hypothetical protein F5I97DRAFT_1877770 [Phlebopus sp. FC_14]|nr:hypothetical protein F5I97DRAFT_1877770 [Phlebopus sp. FC_14]
MSGNSHPPNLRYLAPVFLGLLVTGGQVGLPIIVLTALVSKNVSWHPTLINLCVTWMIYSVIYCLYLYSGANEQNPHRTLCTVQASMVHGASPMSVVASLMVVVQMWSTIQRIQSISLEKIPRGLRLGLMLAPPYVVFVGFAVGVAIVATSEPQIVYPSNGLYCKIYIERLSAVVPSFCAAVLSVILCFEVAISVQYYRQWTAIRRSFPLVIRQPSTRLWFRVGLFCLYSWVTLTSAILFLSDENTALAYMMPATIPLTSVLVFGMQKDIISSWGCVWRERKRSVVTLTLEVPSARATQRPDSLESMTPVKRFGARPWECDTPV